MCRIEWMSSAKEREGESTEHGEKESHESRVASAHP
jgi:hypothetical protein